MKIIIINVLILLVFLSCGTKVVAPEGVLNQEVMAEVITEIELSQALIKLKFSMSDTLFDKAQFYSQVYDDFNITEDQFNSSLVYYCKHPNLLSEIYEDVISNLSEKQEKVTKAP